MRCVEGYSQKKSIIARRIEGFDDFYRFSSKISRRMVSYFLLKGFYEDFNTNSQIYVLLMISEKFFHAKKHIGLKMS